MSEYSRDGKHVDLEQFGVMVRKASARYEEEENDMVNDMVIDISEIQHDETEVAARWEYTVRDGDGELWDEVWTTDDWDETRILEWWKREVEDVRKWRAEGSEWYTDEDYPEPLTIVKRHVRVTTEYSAWEEAS
jgi:hypothetical protein